MTVEDEVVAEDPAMPSLDEVHRTLRDGLRRLLTVDRATLELGVESIVATPERLDLRITVGASQSNGHGVCHGGVIYAVADSAAGLCANSAPGESGWVTASASIDHLAPARLGDPLVARCRPVLQVAGRVKVFVTEVACSDHPVAIVHSTMRRSRRI